MIHDQILAVANELGLTHVVPFGEPENASIPDVLHWHADALGDRQLLDLADVFCSFASLPPGAMLAACVDVTFRAFAGTPKVVLPLRTWKRLFAIAGFDVVDDRALEAPVAATTLPGRWLEQYWRDADLFRQGHLGESQRLLVCQRTALRVDPADLARRVDAALDIQFLRAKRDTHAAALQRPMLLNIHQTQDYLNLRPIIETLDPLRTIPLIREHSEFRPLKRLAIVDDLLRQGFRPRLYTHIEDLNWRDLAGKPLLSATESAITPGHALSRHLVEVAKMSGCPTLLLQHGVWVETFPSGPVSFGSQDILAWGSEHAQCFKRTEMTKLGVPLPRGATPAERFKPIGSPKFADMLTPGDRTGLENRLGVPATQFSGVTLLGTNLHWGRHTDKTPFLRAVARLSRTRPEELFVIKTHPAENFYEYEMLRDDNVLIYDDTLALAADFHIPRLLHGVDRVVSSLSSLLIDASVLGKPVFQYDTGNTIRYEGIEPLPCDALDDIYTAEKTSQAQHRAQTLAAVYADADHLQFYDRLAGILRTTQAKSRVKAEGLASMSAYGLLETMTLERQRTELRLADLQDLLSSGLFDERYYAENIGNLEGLDPIEHFLTRGGWSGRNPRAAFDTQWYAAHYPDVAATGMLPVLHYIRFGAKQGYDPHVVFSTRWYMAQAGALPDATTALGHYLREGEAAGLSCHPLFDAGFYARSVADPAPQSLLEHFITAPAAAGGDPSPAFSASRYLALWPDVASSGINPLLHYLESGITERRVRSDVQRLAR